MEILRALIFDVDGTLADTERDGHRVAFNKAFAECGLAWTWSAERYGELLETTGGKERIRRYLAEEGLLRDDDSVVDGSGDIVPAARLIGELHQCKTRHYVQLLDRGEIPLRPGVARLLGEARAEGLRLAIATTTTPENVTALLGATLGPESLDWFEVIGAGDIVPAKKPAPDIYHYVLDLMGLPPASCIAFEDSENGLRSALDADIPDVVVTVNDYTRAHLFPGAALVLDQLGDASKPYQCLAGDHPGGDVLDVAALRRLHARRAVDAD